MKILLAAWHVRDFNVGLGRYTRGLIEALGRVDRSNSYEVLLPEDTHRFPDHPHVRYRVVRFPLFKRRVWEQLSPLLAGPHDILHFPYDSCVAWKRAKFVTTVHDVKPLLFGTKQAANLNTKIEQFLVGDKWARIDHVLTDSECSRRDIQARLGVKPDRITVVNPGVDLDRFHPSPTHPSSGGVRPYVLSVAGADPTKNVETLIDAFARLPKPLRDQYDLVLIGDFRRRPELHAMVQAAGIERQTVFTGVVDDERLIEYYRGAAVFVFPSRYEGFGLPVLEAMACGCAVVSSNASSLPEIAEGTALLVDPLDVQGMATAIATVLRDDDLREDLRKRGPIHASRFSWDRTAKETIEVYRRVVRG